jgi:hypothetical protein
MTANVKVVVAETHNVLRVPNMAIRFQPPADIIDTVRVRDLRDAFAKNGATGGDGTRQGTPASGDPPSSVNGGPSQGTDPPPKTRKFSRTQRDSSAAAHSGKISQDESRAGVQKNSQSGTGTGFGVTRTFPEYEKAAYVPLHQGGRARLWVVNAKGLLEPVFVQTGVTDGKYTEVTSADLKAGQEIVLGITSTSGVASVQNPLTGGGQQRPGGGGFR